MVCSGADGSTPMNGRFRPAGTCSVRLSKTLYGQYQACDGSVVSRLRMSTVARSEHSNRICNPSASDDTSTLKLAFSLHHRFTSFSCVTHTAGLRRFEGSEVGKFEGLEGANFRTFEPSNVPTPHVVALASFSTPSKAFAHCWNDSGWNMSTKSSPRLWTSRRMPVQASFTPSSPSFKPSYS